MRHILVPTDFSDCAFEALKSAAAIARKGNAVIHLAHVYEKPLSGISLKVRVDIDTLRGVEEGIRQEMDTLARNDALQGLEIQQHFLPDIDVWQMLENEELKEVDLIVIGSHGASGLRELFIGSNAQKIVQTAKCPVLVVKEYMDANDVMDIAFVSNFFGEAETAFTPIKRIVELLDARVHLLKVITPSNFEDMAYSRRLMDDFASKLELKQYTTNIYNAHRIEEGIHGFCQNTGIDLLAIETHGRSGFAHLVSGSIAEHLANHEAIPVLTMKIEEPDMNYGAIFPEVP